jgi:hypothetical protein
MKISNPNSKKLTPEEITELERFKAAIASAIRDGKISSQEVEDLNPMIHSGNHEFKEELYQKLEAYRVLVTEKLENGELQYE